MRERQALRGFLKVVRLPVPEPALEFMCLPFKISLYTNLQVNVLPRRDVCSQGDDDGT